MRFTFLLSVLLCACGGSDADTSQDEPSHNSLPSNPVATPTAATSAAAPSQDTPSANEQSTAQIGALPYAEMSKILAMYAVSEGKPKHETETDIIVKTGKAGAFNQTEGCAAPMKELDRFDHHIEKLQALIASLPVDAGVKYIWTGVRGDGGSVWGSPIETITFEDSATNVLNAFWTYQLAPSTIAQKYCKIAKIDIPTYDSLSEDGKVFYNIFMKK